jgi:pimeloyl-ACP methyl ester carboxylesterase
VITTTAALFSLVLLAGCSASVGLGVGTSTSSTAPVGSTGTASTTRAPTSAPTPASTSTSLPKATLAWTSCDGGTFQCADLGVPLSYSDPGAGTIEIAVVRMPATQSDPIGNIVINPGGPGASGIQFLESSWQSFPAALRARFGLVSFDPRAIGESAPVNCLSPAGIRAYIALDPAPVTASQIQSVVTAEKSFAAACGRDTSRALLDNLSTADTARDMDRLRAALGDAKLTYFGYSYGTYLGSVYAELFPSHVRAMVLDGALDPALGTVAIEQQQAVGFENDLSDFLSWCTTTPQCGAISSSTDPRAAFEALMKRFEDGLVLAANGVPEYEGGPQQVDYGVAVIGVITGLYSPSSWPGLGEALAQAESGNGTGLAENADFYSGAQQDGQYSNIISANTAILCLDRPVPKGVSEYEALAEQLTVVAPDFGGQEAWGSLACAYWPVPPTGAPARVDAPGLAPVLVIGSTRDPATPYQWAQALTSQLPGAVLLTRDGDGHTAYEFSSCIVTWADRYLLTLALPPAGTVCRSSGAGLP